jgi:hypothetical protein
VSLSEAAFTLAPEYVVKVIAGISDWSLDGNQLRDDFVEKVAAANYTDKQSV